MTVYDGPQLLHHYLDDEVFLISMQFHAPNRLYSTIISLIVYCNNKGHKLSIFLRFGSGGALSSTCFDLVDLDLVSDTLEGTAGFVLFLTTTPFRIFLEESFLIIDGFAATGAADII